MTRESRMTGGERHAVMQSMMSQIFCGLGIAEKKEMFETMMDKMTEGLDMKEMMGTMMAGMMPEGGPPCAGKIPDMMAEMMHGGAEQHTAQLPEMMPKLMMPHCIGMMLPSIDTDKRGEIAATILSTLVDNGTVGMSEEQATASRQALHDVLNR